MKFLMCAKKIIFLALVFYFSASYGNSNEATTLLINKFERVYLQLSPEDPTRTSVTLRLADLLSERARVDAMEELNKGCVTCSAGEKDRARAIEFYQEALPKLNNEKRAMVLAQMGHLMELNQRSEEAEDIYKKIISSEKDPVFVAEAKLSLAEMNFKKFKYEAAYDLYSQVLNESRAQRKSLAAYRQAWCLFNMGKTEEAVSKMEVILTTPSLLSKTSDGTVSVDPHYKAEVAKDFSTFVAKKGATLEDMQLVYKLSPESSRLSNISYLANELERLGQKDKSISAFEFVLNKEENPSERLNYHLHLAQLYKDQKNTKSSLENYKKSLYLKKTMDCTQRDCDEVATRLRKYVLDWHTEEKKQPSAALMTAYDTYIDSYPNEVDMIFWQIEAYKVSQSWSKALESLAKVQKIYQANLQTKGKNNTEKLPSFENLLLMRVELAELSQNDSFKKEAYQNYISASQEKTQKLAIQYQLAHMKYKNKEYEAAANEFKELAMMKESKDKKIQLQSADLALDALVVLKDETRLEKWAAELATVFPEKKTEYSTISRKAVFNQATALAQDNNSAQQSWETLKRVNLSGATEEEKLLYYRNRLVLAEKLNRYNEAREAVNELLQMKSLSPEDRQWVLSRQVWLAELALDFGTALKVTEKINMKPYVPEAKDLKLALFAELSGTNAAPFYQRYIQQSKDLDQQSAVALKLVESSSDPVKTLEKYKKYLMKTPEIYSSKLVEYLSLKMNPEDNYPPQSMKSMASSKELAKTPAYLFAWKHNFINDMTIQVQKLASHQLDSSNQVKLNRSLSARIKMLEQMEKTANQAIQMGEWNAQLFVIHHLAQQSQRFYEELLALPMPEGLSDEEQMQYMQLLSQQATPYKIKADELTAKVKSFWTAENLIENLKVKYQTAKEPLRPFVKKELQLIQELAPEEVKAQVVAIMDYTFPKRDLPALAELESAREQVRKNPLDVASLDSLIELEKKSDNKNMVSYLTSRRQLITELKGSAQ